jgi:hypothetical protein
MKILLAVIVVLAGFVPAKLKMESVCQQSAPAALPLDLREKIGQSAFVAVLGGFRSVVADLLFIDAYSAWERTDWAQLLLRLRQATELQPRATLFWEMAGWHMAWNAGTAALEDESKSPATRRRLQSEYLKLGEDFLVRGAAHNPEKPELYEALARLYRDKFHDHARAAENFEKASRLPGHASYDERFSAYELSYCEGREREAYDRLHALYQRGEKERLPRLINQLRSMEEHLNLPANERIP